MKTYEITFITKEDLKDKPVKDVLEKLEGKVLSTSSIGERQFAYKIQKEDRGFYTTVLFNLEPHLLSELNSKLSLTEEIIRFIIIAKKPSELLEKKPRVKPEIKEIARPVEIAKPTEIESPKKIETPEKIEKPVELSAEKVEEEKEVKPEKTVSVDKQKVEVAKQKVVKPKVSKEVTEIETETETEEDRLKALDKKLDELLKE